MRVTKRVPLSKDEVLMLRHALRIGAEDGSLFTGDERPTQADVETYDRLVEKLERAYETL